MFVPTWNKSASLHTIAKGPPKDAPLMSMFDRSIFQDIYKSTENLAMHSEVPRAHSIYDNEHRPKYANPYASRPETARNVRQKLQNPF